MRPGGIHLILLFHTSFRELQVGFLDVRQRTEDILLDGGHNVIKMRNDQSCHRLLILKQSLHLIDSIKPFGLTLDIAGLVLIVVRLLTNEQLLLEAFLEQILLVRVLSIGTVRACHLASRGLGSGMTRRIGFSARLVDFLHFLLQVPL